MNRLYRQTILLTLLILAAGVSASAEEVSVEIIPDRLVYAPGTAGSVAVSLENKGKEAIRGRLLVRVSSGLSSDQSLAEQVVTLKPASADPSRLSLTFPYKASGPEGGREFAARFSPGIGQPAAGREFALVTANPARFSHLGLVIDPFGQDFALKTPAQQESTMRSYVHQDLRSGYYGLMELLAWAPDDFAMLAPEMEQWRSGQTFYYMSKPGIRRLLEEARRQGIWRLFSSSRWNSGPYGYEFARKHPDWVYWGSNWYGGKFDVRQLKLWSDPELAAFPPSRPDLMSITPLVAKPETAAYGIDQALRSLRMFHWDGIAYQNDGWKVADTPLDSFGNRVYSETADPDQLSANLVQQIRASGQKVAAHFLYGDSGTGLRPGIDLTTASTKWRAEAANGGLVIDGGFGDWVHGSGGRFDSLRDYLFRGCRGVRQAGGYPFVSGLTSGNPQVESPADMRILLACALASGAHLCGPAVPLHSELIDEVRLSVRYAELLYGDDLQWIDHPESTLSLISPGPVWWREYVRQRNVGERTQLILHLINQPRYDSYNAGREAGERSFASRPPDCAMPDPGEKWALPSDIQDNIKVTFRAPDGVYVDRAYALSADGGVSQEPLGLLRQGNIVTATLPRLCYWSILVFEYQKR